MRSLCGIFIFLLISVLASSQNTWGGVFGFSIGQVDVQGLNDVPKQTRQLRGQSYGGIKAGVYDRYELTEKLHLSGAVLLHYQRTEISYLENREVEYAQRVFPLSLEIPFHVSLDLIRPENSVSALFGVKYNQSLTNQSDTFLILDDGFWAFDLGIGKEFANGSRPFRPALIYSLGANNVLTHSNVESLRSDSPVLIYLHQISLQICW